jgi:hypothetical protein
LAYDADISHTSVCAILKKHGLVIAKPSWKPGPTEDAKSSSLAFAIVYKNWTLEAWQNVIWSDEISVDLGKRQGVVRV